MKKHLKYFLVFVMASIVILFAQSCKRCTMDLRVGEQLMIPINFEGFNENEINNIMVIRIDRANQDIRDSNFIANITLPIKEGFKRYLTDKPFSSSEKNMVIMKVFLTILI
ncbi:MAG: hypothetical protein J5I91_03100 [Bacteroidetes bacterium]|nr:hypothetical protein [Bacteroidota bacterium]